MIRIFISFFLLGLLFPGQLWAACGGASPTWTAADASLTEVNLCIAGASAGDTINVPAGSANWSGAPSTISGLRLVGAGKNGSGTTITATGAVTVDINGHATKETRLEGFRFVYSNTSNTVKLDVDSDISYEPVVIYNVYISYTGGGDHSTSGVVNINCAYGVMSNVDLINFSGEIVYVNCTNEDPWDVSPGPVDFGTADFFFIEDSTWYSSSVPASQHAIMTDDSGKTVARYNSIDGPLNIDSHGWCNASAGSYGARATEIYGNTWTGVSGKSNTINFRGGPGYIWGNSVTGGDPNRFITFTEYRLHYDTSLCAYRGCPGVYPAGQQIGWDLSAAGTFDVDADYELRPIYMWNNAADGVLSYRYITPGVGECPTGLGGGTAANVQVGREIFDSEDGMVASGLSSAKPGTCTDNYGYWATDTQKLYSCLSNVWTEIYSPYTYPHPLTQPGPVRSAGSPSSSLSYSTTTTLSLYTSTNATCKYGTIAETAYASIANTFTTADGYSHSQSGVAVSPGTNTFYARCTDGTYTNTTDYIISFSMLAQSSARVGLSSTGTGKFGPSAAGTGKLIIAAP